MRYFTTSLDEEEALGGTVWSDVIPDEETRHSSKSWQEFMLEDWKSPGRFSKEARATIARHWLVTSFDKNIEPDLFGSFSQFRATGTIVAKEGIVELIESFTPSVNEYVPVPKIWNKATRSPVQRPDFFLVNILSRFPGIQNVNRVQRKNGTFYYRTEGKPILQLENIKDAHLWRDTHTNEVFLSEDFRQVFESCGARGLLFREVSTI